MQSAFLQQGNTTIEIKLPEATDEVIRGVKWGLVCAFPTPAYWKYQVLARRLQGAPIRYRLGRTLKEEVAACLLAEPIDAAQATHENPRQTSRHHRYRLPRRR